MTVFTKKETIAQYLQKILLNNNTIGFVPTMGALHNGHLSLLKKSISNNDVTVVSIFVNPTQFNNADDLKKYPRTFTKDVEKIAALSSEIIIYKPETDDIYDGTVSVGTFNFNGLELQMEGKFRPGHFDGVATIVKKLLTIIQPSVAYFGEKDFQQLQIVKKMVVQEQLHTKIVGCPIFREPNGLAMSSRNERLSAKGKEKAGLIFAIITKAKMYFKNHSAAKTIIFVEKQFLLHPEFRLEYFQIADEATLTPCKHKRKNKKYRAFVAVYLENIRLIDTISLS